MAYASSKGTAPAAAEHGSVGASLAGLKLPPGHRRLEEEIANLPIRAVICEAVSSLVEGPSLVLEASPGAGKTTTLPLAVLLSPSSRSWLRDDQRIIVLEPRRLAARRAAARMASLLEEEVGERVGYRVRLDAKCSPDTRIEAVTDGILLARLRCEPLMPPFCPCVR